MRRLKVLLVGAGTVGEAIAKIAKGKPWLERWCSPTTTSIERARSRRCSATAPRRRSRRAFVDASDIGAVVSLAREQGVDLIMNAADPRFVPALFDAAFEAGIGLHGHGRQPVRAGRERPVPHARACCSATTSSPRHDAWRGRRPPRAPRDGHGPRPHRRVRPLRRAASSSTRSTRSTSATAATCTSRATPSRRSSASGRPSRSASTRR